MAVYKTRWFDRWARKHDLSTRALCEAVREMQAGLYEADLGGGLLKKRIARRGKASAAVFVRWWRRTKVASGFSYLAFRRMFGAISTRTRNKV